ncbi:VOC family protein [Indiicoccus explosivorum]|uniref:VOC family protein n=1 Tax=Indiicoccus explosivorum TaxID=1917864 RepID=UPI000B42D45A|nr:VOC family protein [Indiicoccus explosivorum]
MSASFTRIDTVFLPVTDLDRSIQWYTGTFGFPIRWTHTEGGYACLDIGETPLTLVRTDAVTPEAHMRFNFFVTDPDAAHRQLTERGAGPSAIHHDGNLQWFDFTDPDGHKLGVCHFSE